MINQNNYQITLRKLPFYWRVRNSLSDKNVVPDFLPFTLSFDPTFGLFRQKQNRSVLKHLSTIYKMADNIGHNQDISNWKNFYGGDLFDFVSDTISKRVLPTRSILEIGCGGCVVLEKFIKPGVKLLGIDPTPMASEAGKRKNIPVIKDFFPSSQITETYDLIYNSNVLEHLDDPYEFLLRQKEHLKPDGTIAFAVPDCTAPLRGGDISMCYHQHISYFDTSSLKRLVRAAGFHHVSVKRAGYGGNLYCTGVNQSTKHKKKSTTRNNQNTLDEFENKHNEVFIRFSAYVSAILKDKKKILGFYAPLRVIPYISKMKRYDGFRFFDDTSYWHNKYFDGIQIKIENFDDLVEHPVTDIIVMSPTFHKVIEKKIREKFGKTIRIANITQFYEK